MSAQISGRQIKRRSDQECVERVGEGVKSRDQARCARVGRQFVGQEIDRVRQRTKREFRIASRGMEVRITDKRVDRAGEHANGADQVGVGNRMFPRGNFLQIVNRFRGGVDRRQQTARPIGRCQRIHDRVDRVRDVADTEVQGSDFTVCRIKEAASKEIHNISEIGEAVSEEILEISQVKEAVLKKIFEVCTIEDRTIEDRRDVIAALISPLNLSDETVDRARKRVGGM